MVNKTMKIVSMLFAFLFALMVVLLTSLARGRPQLLEGGLLIRLKEQVNILAAVIAAGCKRAAWTTAGAGFNWSVSAVTRDVIFGGDGGVGAIV
jgi:hypothetical protein